jgi:hypothetical protein
MLPRPRAAGLTAAEMGAFIRWMMWSNVAQMAAEMLLLLPGSWSERSRRAPAYAAFAATVTSHIMMACWLYALVLTADLNIGAWMTVYFHMFFFLSAGLGCLKALLGHGDYAN